MQKQSPFGCKENRGKKEKKKGNQTLGYRESFRIKIGRQKIDKLIYPLPCFLGNQKQYTMKNYSRKDNGEWVRVVLCIPE